MPTLARALLYARTLRHLRWEQWLYRPLRALQMRRPPRPAPPGAVAVERVRALADAVRAWPTPPTPAVLRAADAVVAGRFRFLNHEEVLTQIDWQRRYVSHLWSYNLHYFDYAPELARAFRATGDVGYVRRLEVLAEGWIRGTAGGRGDGWEPYALSLRAVNWIYALLLLGEALGPAARAAMEESLRAQLAFLQRRLELHVLGNHLQKNLKALAVGGLYFSGRAAESWLRKGSRLLWRELHEQVLPDGVHYERSPMYHALALADFLEVADLLRAAGQPVPEPAVARIGRMAQAFGVLCRPNGTLHLFQDAAQGIAPRRPWLDVMARRVVGHGIPEPAGCLALPDAGYFGWVDAVAGERLLVDCGAPGPAYQPGHAHCGLLGFELDLAGRPVLVDAGVSGYDGDPLREYVRSTRAHNTVSIAGREQSEVWGTFRLARRATVRAADQACPDGAYRFSGACVPYHTRSAIHRRTVERVGGAWKVTDRVTGAPGAPLTSYLHFHPDFEVRAAGRAVTARADRVAVRVEPFGVDDVVVRRGEWGAAPQGWHCPEFGVALPAAALEMRLGAADDHEFGYRIRLVEEGRDA